MLTIAEFIYYQNLSKNINIVKHFYNLKEQFYVLRYFKM